jgi:hypothetical protein
MMLDVDAASHIVKLNHRFSSLRGYHLADPRVMTVKMMAIRF